MGGEPIVNDKSKEIIGGAFGDWLNEVGLYRDTVIKIYAQGKRMAIKEINSVYGNEVHINLEPYHPKRAPLPEQLKATRKELSDLKKNVRQTRYIAMARHAIEGATYKEISKVHSMSVGTLTSWIERVFEDGLEERFNAAKEADGLEGIVIPGDGPDEKCYPHRDPGKNQQALIDELKVKGWTGGEYYGMDIKTMRKHKDYWHAVIDATEKRWGVNPS